jgi:hypothetical protein
MGAGLNKRGLPPIRSSFMLCFMANFDKKEDLDYPLLVIKIKTLKL